MIAAPLFSFRVRTIPGAGEAPQGRGRSGNTRACRVGRGPGTASKAADAVPVRLGGDHSVTYPIIRAFAPLFEAQGPLAGQKVHIVQIDSHLDFMDTVSGFPRSNSSPIRRAAELPFVGGVTVLGIRGLRTNRAAYRAGVDRGHRRSAPGRPAPSRMV